jgi:hypothetical protein
VSEAEVLSVSLKMDKIEYRAVIKFFAKRRFNAKGNSFFQIILKLEIRFFIVRPRTFQSILVNA